MKKGSVYNWSRGWRIAAAEPVRLKNSIKPRTAELNNYYHDGRMRFDGNAGAAVNYAPNSFGGPLTDSAFAEPQLKISGDADRCDQKRGVDDDYIQPGNLFRLIPFDEQQRLIQNIDGAMKNLLKAIQQKMLGHFRKADQAYCDGVAKGLGL